MIITDSAVDSGEGPGLHITGDDDVSSDAALSVNTVRGPYVGDLTTTSLAACWRVECGAVAGVYLGPFDSCGPGCHVTDSFVVEA